ncbi:DUF4112 domain-containing protein [Inquilinus sp. CAU 1745]|uniref:DUF4112 domain-containing protein n=1 Tax=Inquilinus sp. CAU 1745 TaxID=3140369 RepID=UPI00325B6BE7
MAGSPSHHERRKLIEELDRIAWWLDDRFRVPGLGWRFGLDGLVGLAPGVGDAASGSVSAYLVWRARKLGVPNAILARMIWNVGIDVVVGSVPVLGSLFDFGWKANRRNIRLLRRHLEETTDPAIGPPR